MLDSVLVQRVPGQYQHCSPGEQLGVHTPPCVGHDERVALMETLFLAKSTERLMLLLMHACIYFMKE